MPKSRARRPEERVLANYAAMKSNRDNLDRATVDDFGREWQRFDQSGVSSAEVRRRFGEYFALFPWDSLPRNAVGFDAGCGSGRWAALVAPRVGRLHCVDASADALSVAQKSLSGLSNVEFHAAPLDAMPLPDDSMDFGYSLGVLHHLPDPAAGLAACAFEGALSLEVRGCRTSCCLRLLAPGARSVAIRAAGRQCRRLAAQRLSRAQLLCDAHRRARPFRHAARASHDASRDPSVNGERRPGRSTL